MELLSINVATPRILFTVAQRFETGIFKEPVNGPVRVGKFNLEGDRQADLSVHGGLDKAVYAYSWKNVEYWRKALERSDLGPGTFGENLTVDELLDTEVSIGDELEIGTARFLVTQPRFPCYKLGIKMGDHAFVETFDRSGRNGFYLRVLQEGTITAGDKIRRIKNEESAAITVAEFVRIYRTRNATGPKISSAEISRLLGLSALPESMKAWLKEKFKKQLERRV